MESIHSTLRQWLQQDEAFLQRHAAMKAEILANPLVQQFLEDNPQITAATIDKRLNKLYEFTSQSIHCAHCKSVQTCTNIVRGHTPKLLNVNNDIHIVYEKCSKQIHYETVIQKENLIQSVYIPQEILQAKVSDLYIDAGRTEAIKLMDQFLNEARNKLPEKGIYFTGPFGVGKTYFLGAIANELQKLHISSMIVYMPEFVQNIRSGIHDNTVQEKIDLYKTAEVLMFDDIGAETLSAWFRDEVLGSILQYRMMERLPVFFTSNYTMDQLEEVLSTTTRGDVEKVKAGRIMERIKEVSKEVVVDGVNYRKQ